MAVAQLHRGLVALGTRGIAAKLQSNST